MTQIIEMNNMAVFQIRKQNYIKAISILARAAKASKELISKENMVLVKRNESSSCFRCYFRCSESSFLKTFQNGIVSQRSIFQDPIYITSPRMDSALGNCGLVCYVTLYNLALAHHLRATSMENRTSQIVYLQTAQKLYETSCQILLSQNTGIPLFHSMVISSNLGQIHYVLGNITMANQFYKRLLSLILVAVDSGEASKVKSLDGFIGNVMPLIVKVSSAPAA